MAEILVPERRLLRLHFLYVSGILGGISIVLATYEWTSLSGFTEYLSVAANMTSLVLAVLAIILSFLSSDSLSGTLSSLLRTSNEVEKGAIAVNSAIAEATQRATERDQRMLDLVERVGVQMGALGDSLELATTKIDASVTGQSAKIESLHAAFEKSKAAVTTEQATPVSQQQATSGNAMERFIRGSSISGLTVLAVCKWALETAKPVDTTWLSEQTTMNAGYYDGYLVAGVALGLLEVAKHSAGYTVKGHDPALNGVEEQFRKTLANIDTSGIANSSAWKAGLEAKFGAVKAAYFDPATTVESTTRAK
jgi:hypothetical protein